MSLFLRRIVLLALAAFLGACGNGDSEPAVVKVQLSPSAVLVSEIGANFVLGATGTDANGAPRASLPAQFTWSSSNLEIASVDAEGKVVGKKAGTAFITAMNNGLSARCEVKVQVSDRRVTGTARYQDKEYDAKGFTGNSSYKPIRNAVVDLLDETGRVMVSAHSNNAGEYDLGAVWPNRFYVRVLAQSQTQVGTHIARVADNANATYALAKVATWDSTELSLTANTIDEPDGAFNVLDVMQRGFEMVSAQGASLPERLTAFWQPNSDNSTVYCTGGASEECPNGEGIYVANGVDSRGIFDSDEFDDDVLWHEFGHFVAAGLSRDDSFGGYHEIGELTTDLRLAWSEGWGDYFAVAVRAWLHANIATASSSAPSMPDGSYVDTRNSSSLFFDLGATPDTSKDGYYYANSEYAVARILWHMDRQGYIQGLFGAVTSPLLWGSPNPISLETLWDIWLDAATAASATSERNALIANFQERRVFYTPDTYEPNDTLATARLLTPGDSASGNLYHASTGGSPGSDIDLFSFDVTVGARFVVETSELTNLGNTRLRVLNAAGSVVSVLGVPLVNDDAPSSSDNAANKAARLEFVAAVNGRYFAEITTSPNLSRQEGRYGGYTIQLLAY